MVERTIKYFTSFYNIRHIIRVIFLLGGDEYERKKWIVIGIIVLIGIIIFAINYNSLSKYETMEKFLDLVSWSEYEKAKKYITSNFKWDLSAVKRQNLEKKENFTDSYKNYYLEDDYDIAYIVADTGLRNNSYI